MSQTKAILEHLQKGHTLTPLDAVKLFNCMRLGARIWDLRRSGYNIQTDIITTRSGKHIARYRLEAACRGN
jgi:hypothetical protein